MNSKSDEELIRVEFIENLKKFRIFFFQKRTSWEKKLLTEKQFDSGLRAKREKCLIASILVWILGVNGLLIFSRSC